jgi:hypothetical protein
VLKERRGKLSVLSAFKEPMLEEVSLISTSVLNNCIAMIVYDIQETVTEKIFDIWVMREYGVKVSWTKQFVIRPLSGIQFPLGFAKNDELLLVDNSGQLVSYNSNAQEIMSLQVRGF